MWEHNETVDYYDQKAAEYIQRTFTWNMSQDQDRFLKCLPSKGAILDAGCGSGRDALMFKNRGYEVIAIDASKEMVKHTKGLGIDARVMSFDQIHWKETFEGIWCSASLVHVPKEELKEVISKIYTALKPGAILFVSFKQGEGAKIENGRYFYMMNESELRSYFSAFTLLEIWRNESDKNLTPTVWLNALFRK